MAIPTPRVIFACAIPAIIVILSYIWFKRKKELEDQIHQEHITQENLPYNNKEITYQRVPESDFHQLPTENTLQLTKMVIETTTDKEDPCLEKKEECEEYDAAGTDSPVISCEMYREVMHETPLPPLVKPVVHYGELNGFQVPCASDSQLEEVAEVLVARSVSPTLPKGGTHLELTESVTKGIKELAFNKYPEESVKTVGDASFCTNTSKDLTVLECGKDFKLSPQGSSGDLEPALTKDHIVKETSPYLLDIKSSPDSVNTSHEDTQDPQNVERSTDARHMFLDDSKCSLDVVRTPDLFQSFCSLNAGVLSRILNASSEDSQRSPIVKPNLSDEEISPKESKCITTSAITQPTLPRWPNSSASDAVASFNDTPEMVSTSQKSSLDIVPTSLEGSTNMGPTLEESQQIEDTDPKVPDTAESKVIEASPLQDSTQFLTVECQIPVSLPSSPDVTSTFSACAQDVELTLDSESHREEVGSDTRSVACTLTMTLIGMENGPVETVSNWNMGGDGDPGAGCAPVFAPDFPIAGTDQLQLEIKESHIATNLSCDEAELRKLANCGSLSTYGSSSHSPADDLLESPTTSNYSDLHSEGSSDSGKGGSDIHTPNVEGSNSHFPPTSLQVYEFEIPQGLCGRLIGVRGRYVNLIKSKSRANISIKRHPFNPDLKLCAVIGTEEDINLALGLIRKRFPASKFPVVNMLQVNTPLLNGIPLPETLQLHLPDIVTCDVILSSLVNTGHFFVQQPTHPTYSSLSRLDQYMLQCYQNGMNAPELPKPVEAGIICAASTMGGWYRAQIVYVYPDSNECELKFVDYGGYLKESISTLRQIRSDFMSLPFQASECFLANVTPIDENQGWSIEAISCFEDMAQGQILQAQIMSYSEDGIPYVHLYRVQGVTTTFINRQLVSSGHAKWVENQA